MYFLLFIGGRDPLFYLMFNAPDWADFNNSVKSTIGCSIMALMFFLWYY